MPDGLLALEALTAEEADRLARLEADVERGRQTFIEVGNALAAIHDERLYKGTHTAFADYLHERWGMSRQRGYQLIDAAEVAGLVSGDGVSTTVDTFEIPDDFAVAEDASGQWGQNGRLATRHEERRAADLAERQQPAPELPPPANERVARRLAATAKTDPDRAKEIWRQTVERHGPDATAEQVAEVASGAQVLPDVSEDVKRCTAAIRRAVKHRDSQAAKQALAIWRATVYRELDRIARGQP